MKIRIIVSAVLSVLLLAALAANVHAAEVKITASDGAAHDEFGYSVAISGDYAVVGAEGDDDSSGSAYIFKRNGTAWTEQAKITASDGAAWDRFGISVAISGDYAVAGAFGDDDRGQSSGSAYIFKRNGTAWTEQAKITASDGAKYDSFGMSVAISCGYAIVGAHYNDDAGYDSGSAYIYDTISDSTAPASITSLDNATYEQTYINWTWTDPADANFSKVMVYLDGIYKEDVLKGVQCYNATGLTADTEHEIATRTVDNAGNINATWVNDTAMTAPVPEQYVFTTADAGIALQIAVGSRPPNSRYDVSGDGSVTSLDALMILQAVAGSTEIG